MENNIKNIVNDIKNFIRQGFSLKIDGMNLNPDVVYQNAETNYHSRNKFISVNSSIPFSISTTHLPQSRIFLTNIENEFIHLSILQYFSINVLLVEKIENQSALNINSHKFKPYDTIENGLEDDGIYILAQDDNINKQNIVNYLYEIYKKEIAIHPLSSLNSRDKQLLNDIDNNWANITGISEENLINDNSYLFWLQEIFIHFYKINELSQFYKPYSTDEINEDKDLKDSYNRFQCIIGENLPDLSSNMNDSVFKEYIFLQKDKDPLYEYIQSSWRKIAYPAKEIYFSHKLNENPNEYISLLLLAVRENFFWYPLLYEKIKKNLTDKKLLLIISLLYKLKQHSNIKIIKDEISFSPQEQEVINNKIFISSINTIISFYKSYGKYVTNFSEKNSGLQFKIDKKVNFLFTKSENLLQLSPFVYQPPFDIVFSNVISVKINNYNLKIPLIWRQFSIQMNSCRVKFLLKKKRWQLTFKIDENIKNIYIDEEEIQFSAKRYFSIDYNNEITGSKSYLNVYDKYGIQQDYIPKGIKEMFLRGIGIRSNGLLAESFNINRKKSAKSLIINTNKKNVELIPVNNGQVNWSITTAKFNRQIITLNRESGLITGIKYMPAADLRYKLIILIETLSDEEISIINNLFYKHFRFYPQIIKAGERYLSKERFYIIISKNNKYDFLNLTCKDIPVVILPKSNINALFIEQSNLLNNLNRFLTCI